MKITSQEYQLPFEKSLLEKSFELFIVLEIIISDLSLACLL